MINNLYLEMILTEMSKIFKKNKVPLFKGGRYLLGPNFSVERTEDGEDIEISIAKHISPEEKEKLLTTFREGKEQIMEKFHCLFSSV